MKRNASKRLFVVLLSVVMLALVPAQALALQGVGDLPHVTHTHNFVFYANSYTYIQGNSQYHLKGTQPFYQCECGEIAFGEMTWITQTHTMSGWSYNGNNYHSGTMHYTQYERYCIYCRYTEYRWNPPYQCPGGGRCILPLSIGLVVG